MDHTFYQFPRVLTNLGCWENTQKVCKSLALSWWLTTFDFVLPASQASYFTCNFGKKIVESALLRVWINISQSSLGLKINFGQNTEHLSNKW